MIDAGATGAWKYLQFDNGQEKGATMPFQDREAYSRPWRISPNWTIPDGLR